MTAYHGNGAYCYANSASMLLSTIGEDISPSLIEVLTGFALGACIDAENNFLFFDNCTSSPDKGINHAFEILGFKVVEKVYKDGESIPLNELKDDLNRSPVMLGPLDMGYLTYHPNHHYLGGSDHYGLALDFNENEILLHDPAGFPFVWLPFDQLELAWRAEKITWSVGSFRSWVSPTRVSNPASEEIYEHAIQLFKTGYLNQNNFAVKENRLVGKEGIRLKAAQIKGGNISNGEIGHFIHFAFPLGARRSHDFSIFFKDRNEQLASLKDQQAQLFGKCQTFAVSKRWDVVAQTLELLADVESDIESAILSL